MPRQSKSLLIMMTASLVFCIILALDLIQALRGDFGWRWPYESPEAPRLIPVLALALLYVVGALRLRRGVVLLSFAGAVLLPLAALFIQGDPLYLLTVRTLSGGATGAHLAGVEIVDVVQTLRDWPQIMPTFLNPNAHLMTSVHVALSPPGLPLLFYGADRFFRVAPGLAEPLATALRHYQCQNFAIIAYDNAELASAWLGILVPLWAALAVFPLYRAGGKWAALWWPLVPSLALFTPNWNTIYPLLALIAYVLLTDALKHTGQRFALLCVGSGLIISLLTFLNISTVPLCGFFGLYACFATWQQEKHQWRAILARLIPAGIWFSLGAISLWALYFLVSGVTPLAILSVALDQHFELDRPYLPWVALHIYDLLLFTGFPLALVALTRLNRRADPLAAALALTLIVMALSGTARGETGRVWMFFAPFVLLVAARQVEEKAPGGSGLITVAQAVTLITLAAFLRTMNTELSAPPTRPPDTQAQASAESLAAPVTFAESLSLTGVRAIYNPAGQAIDLTLTWQADRWAALPYYFSALVVKPDGQPFGQADNWQPFDTKYPTTCWAPGQIITEKRVLPLGSDAPPGDYWISLSAFALRNGQRLSVTVTQPAAPDDTRFESGRSKCPEPIHFSRT